MTKIMPSLQNLIKLSYDAPAFPRSYLYLTYSKSVFGKSKCEQKGLQKVSTFSTRFYDVSKAFLGTKCSPFEYPGRRGLLQEWVPWGPNAHFGTQRPIALILSTLRVRPLAV